MIGGILLVAAAVLGVVSVVQKSPYSHTDAYPVARRVQLFVSVTILRLIVKAACPTNGLSTTLRSFSM